MKIAVTISCPMQVGVDRWITTPSTKIFDSSENIELMLRWIKSSNSILTIRDLKMSEIEDTLAGATYAHAPFLPDP